jgi:tryptophan-rich sensory protein
MNKQLFINLVDKLRWVDQIVSYVWIALSLLIFISAWIIYQEKGFNRDFWYIIAIVVATFTYPLYTLGFKLVPGLIGNILYVAFTIFVITQIKQTSALASYFAISHCFMGDICDPICYLAVISQIITLKYELKRS